MHRVSSNPCKQVVTDHPDVRINVAKKEEKNGANLSDLFGSGSTLHRTGGYCKGEIGMLIRWHGTSFHCVARVPRSRDYLRAGE